MERALLLSNPPKSTSEPGLDSLSLYWLAQCEGRSEWNPCLQLVSKHPIQHHFQHPFQHHFQPHFQLQYPPLPIQHPFPPIMSTSSTTRVIVITGAARGIGVSSNHLITPLIGSESHLELVDPQLEWVKQYATEQTLIVAVVRSPESATELKKLAGDKIIIVKGDMEQPETFDVSRPTSLPFVLCATIVADHIDLITRLWLKRSPSTPVVE
jgi:hypothetical protein